MESQEPIKLLTATIIADEDHHYFVSFETHRPGLRTTEYIRLVLLFYAKMLFIPDPLDPEQAAAALFLRDTMQRVVDKGISGQSDIFNSADIGDVAQMIATPPSNIPRRIIVDLYFTNESMRTISTDLPPNFYLQQTSFSVFALLQTIIRELAERDVLLMTKALFNMNKLYASGYDYRNLGMLDAVPNLAFLEAIMDDNEREPS